jgi:hypothetical protein
MLRKGHSQVVANKGNTDCWRLQPLGAFGKLGDATGPPMPPRLQEGLFPPQQTAFCAVRSGAICGG